MTHIECEQSSLLKCPNKIAFFLLQTNNEEDNLDHAPIVPTGNGILLKANGTKQLAF